MTLSENLFLDKLYLEGIVPLEVEDRDLELGSIWRRKKLRHPHHLTCIHTAHCFVYGRTEWNLIK